MTRAFGRREFLRVSALLGGDYRRSLHNEWGLSLWLESQIAEQQRTMLLDYGYTPGVLANNMELMGVDPSKIDALIMSHGHYDHLGGMLGFLERFRAKLSPDMKLYAGGEDNFCHRVTRTGTPGQFADYGTLDRREIAAQGSPPSWPRSRSSSPATPSPRAPSSAPASRRCSRTRSLNSR
jgi:7,8-dihydropterin-6-yl-methyl-4-(beta-D-ribofuranosyl)aminobenzene 5'-phosphate synthase